MSNSVAVGTEGVRPLWSALESLTEATVLARLVVAGARPQAGRMLQRAVEGFTPATELANRLVLEAGLPFRRAHHRVGEMVTAASEGGETLDGCAERLFGEYGVAVEPGWLDPAAVAAEAAYGGGPADPSLRRILRELREGWTEASRRAGEHSRRWREGARALDLAVAGLLARELPSPAPEVAVPGGAGP